MKKVPTIVIIIIGVLAFTVFVSNIPYILNKGKNIVNNLKEKERVKQVKVEYISQYIDDNRDILLMKIAMIESKFDTTAVGGNAVGILQITPILVKECNTIIGKELYTLEDRKYLKKSIEMFDIIMCKHNPTYDMNKGLSLWNSGNINGNVPNYKNKANNIK